MGTVKDIDFLRDQIEQRESCTAKHVESVPVHEEFQGKTVWQGEVEVFDLEGHKLTKRCYAWMYDLNGKKIVHHVLNIHPVFSPKTAVQAMIAATFMQGKK